MGRAITDAVWIFAAVLALLVIAAAVLASRRYLLERSGGTVECAVRQPAESGTWRLGVLSYQKDSLCWYGALGVLLRPEHVYSRRAFSVVSRRPTLPSETVTLGADRIVVELAIGTEAGGSGLPVGEGAERVEFAMTEEALTGFLAWIEAAPPGSHLGEILIAAAVRLSEGQRSPPGRHSTSPVPVSPSFAARARMNSRSDRRFRYLAGHGLIVSPWSATAAHEVRSARRTTARAVCSSAAPGVPPGSTNDRRTGRSAFHASQADSSAVR